MLKSFRVKRLKADLQAAGEDWARDEAAIVEATNVVRRVLAGRTFKFTNAALVETRSTGGAAFASAPVNILGVKFRVGGAVPVKREAMTVIDTGTFAIEERQASFVGGKHQRTWAYSKIVGYSTEATNELLIGVSNRQRMSGIRYGAGSDFLVDAAFNAAVERYRGNDSAVSTWARTILVDLQKRIDTGKQRFESAGSKMASELAELVGRDEATEFLRTVPGVASANAPPIEA